MNAVKGACHSAMLIVRRTVFTGDGFKLNSVLVLVFTVNVFSENLFTKLHKSFDKHLSSREILWRSCVYTVRIFCEDPPASILFGRLSAVWTSLLPSVSHRSVQIRMKFKRQTCI